MGTNYIVGTWLGWVRWTVGGWEGGDVVGGFGDVGFSNALQKLSVAGDAPQHCPVFPTGMERVATGGMALYTLDELVAYQLSMELKKQVLELIYRSPAQHDAKLASQMGDAASSVPSNIAEGFYRFNPGEFAQFVKYARGSLQEVRTRLPDGVAKRYYTDADIAGILTQAERLARVLGGLYFSLKRQAEARRRRAGEPNSPNPPYPRPHRPPKPR